MFYVFFLYLAGIWSVLTLGLTIKSGNESAEEELKPRPLLAEQSLHLVLVLVHHCPNDKILSNPYRQALFSFTNSQGEFKMMSIMIMCLYKY